MLPFNQHFESWMTVFASPPLSTKLHNRRKVCKSQSGVGSMPGILLSDKVVVRWLRCWTPRLDCFKYEGVWENPVDSANVLKDTNPMAATKIAREADGVARIVMVNAGRHAMFRYQVEVAVCGSFSEVVLEHTCNQSHMLLHSSVLLPILFTSSVRQFDCRSFHNME